jgi:hypothetical protein
MRQAVLAITSMLPLLFGDRPIDLRVKPNPAAISSNPVGFPVGVPNYADHMQRLRQIAQPAVPGGFLTWKASAKGAHAIFHVKF